MAEKTWAEENEEFLRSRRGDEEEVIGTPGDLPPFWKPLAEGEELVARLIKIKPTKFKTALSLRRMDDGTMITVPIGAGLENYDWPRLIGKVLRFTFAGNIETKTGEMKQFRIAVVKEGEEVPF